MCLIAMRIRYGADATSERDTGGVPWLKDENSTYKQAG